MISDENGTLAMQIRTNWKQKYAGMISDEIEAPLTQIRMNCE